MQTYSGSCHCGKVKFEVTADISRGGVCNCSICNRVGWTMISVPTAQFRLIAGEDAQADYQFGPRTMHHLFCTTCGIHAYGMWGDKAIVNLRCLDGVDLDALAVDRFDGKSY